MHFSTIEFSGVGHRDLKPDNIMIVTDAAIPGGERTKLLDFGIAKLAESVDKNHVKTRTNAVLGTPVYMSPEQCRGAAQVDDKSDAYSLGVMLYVMLSGHQLFTGEGAGEIMAKHIFHTPPLLTSVIVGLPEPLVELVHALLVKDKEQRPAMRQVVEALDALGVLPVGATQPSSAPLQLAQLGVGPSALAHHPSTLGQSAGQSQRQSVRKNGWVIGMGAAAGLVASFTIISVQRPTRSIAPVTAAAQPKAAQVVHFQVRSLPAGAQVIRQLDGVPLGTTPWSSEQPARPGELTLSLRLTGYQERTVRLAQGANADLLETLAALPTDQTRTVDSPSTPKKAAVGKISALLHKSVAAPLRPTVRRAYEE